MKPTGANPSTTVGILYCGDMGSALGKLLRKGGLRVITTCEGRSPVTQEQARTAGIEILPNLQDVVAQSDFVFSLVLPAAAVDVARQYISCREMRPQDSVFVDANSIGLETLGQIQCLMAGQNIPLVDATFHGVARCLEEVGVLYVSGPKGRSVEAICEGCLPVNWLGTGIGSASVMKLLMAGISKGLATLFLEVCALAERAGTLESFMQSCQHFYSPMMTVIERTLPTYPRHAARRVGEIRQIEQLGRAFDMHPGMIHEAGKWIQLIASLKWDEKTLGSPDDMRTIIQAVAKACAAGDSRNSFSEV